MKKELLIIWITGDTDFTDQDYLNEICEELVGQLSLEYDEVPPIRVINEGNDGVETLADIWASLNLHWYEKHKNPLADCDYLWIFTTEGNKESEKLIQDARNQLKHVTIVHL